MLRCRKKLEFVRFFARSDSIFFFFFFFSSPSLSSSSSSSSQCPLLRSLGASQSSSSSNLSLNVCFLLTYYPTSLQPPTKSTAPAARVLSLGQKFRQNEIKINRKWNILSQFSYFYWKKVDKSRDYYYFGPHIWTLISD
jgi:hypothetical protein